MSARERILDTSAGQFLGSLAMGGAAGLGASELVNVIADKMVFPLPLFAGIGAVAGIADLIWSKLKQ